MAEEETTETTVDYTGEHSESNDGSSSDSGETERVSSDSSGTSESSHPDLPIGTFVQFAGLVTLRYQRAGRLLVLVDRPRGRRFIGIETPMQWRNHRLMNLMVPPPVDRADILRRIRRPVGRGVRSAPRAPSPEPHNPYEHVNGYGGDESEGESSVEY